MVFCNDFDGEELEENKGVTILILIDGFLQFKNKEDKLIKSYKSQSLF